MTRMEKLALILAGALASGCMIEFHTTPRLRDWTELAEGGEAVAHVDEGDNPEVGLVSQNVIPSRKSLSCLIL